jgi:hypothetical protein
MLSGWFCLDWLQLAYFWHLLIPLLNKGGENQETKESESQGTKGSGSQI